MLLLAAWRIFGPAPKSVKEWEGEGEKPRGEGMSAAVGHIKTDVSCDLCDIL